jgi:hypothetical protein
VVISGKQLGFSNYELTTAKKQTKWEKFFGEMEAVGALAGPELSDRAPLP